MFECLKIYNLFMQIIECVPNFSEGQNMEIISMITNEIESIEGVKLLNVDPGKATNRTVVTFAGNPASVVEAAFRAIAKASELIDMSKHKGEHPRMGATDVCPLIPIAGISMEETAEWSKKLAKRVGEELNIAVYLYEESQTDKTRNNLSVIRQGEYEGFFTKINDPKWKPDFGPQQHSVKSGSTVIGARDFLVAYNVNLNTTSVRRANSVAFDVREAGRVIREGNPITGKIITNENGAPVFQPGKLKSVKAIGWFIEEYGLAQVSMNLTNINVTPVHLAFDECCISANSRGIRVTGSELIGLIPLKSLLDAGKYFLEKQKRSIGVSEDELIKIAIKSMGLDELAPFEPEKRIIEYLLFPKQKNSLIHKNLIEFANETASESPAPGGGSISAYLGVLGASLGTMVANLSSHKKGWDDRWKEFSDWADNGQQLKNKLLKLVDEDTNAFNKIMEAFSLPKSNEMEINARKNAIQEATLNATLIPLEVMQTCLQTFPLIKTMAEIGNPNSISDAGVAALSCRAAIRGAYMNVRINSKDLADKIKMNELNEEGKIINELAEKLESEIIEIVNLKIG
jgi:glutamate formiminotransferase/formiminotetrahydrofolate cyclodeaminase